MLYIVAHRSLDRLIRLLALALLLAGLLAVAPPVRAAGPIVYVHAAATGSGDGSSWANAYPQLSSALAAAPSGTAIWVAAGTYRPTTGGDRSASFQLKAGVAIYGGFAGSETLLSQRNWITNVVTLSGDLLGDDVGFSNTAENSYHVVTGATGATLDGLTISGGNATGTGLAIKGGGILNIASSPTLRNVVIRGNTGAYGGGMLNVDSSSPDLTNVVISGNSASQGGGLYNYHSSPVLTNVTISGNSASNQGGGLYNAAESAPKLRNSIVWGNSSGIVNTSASTPTISFSLVQGAGGSGAWNPAVGVDGGGNLDRDPQFAAPVPAAPSSAGDLHLQPGSPALDAGATAVTNPGLPATDRDGNPRISGTSVDMGAYERQVLTRYVGLAATGSGDGSSWANAYPQLSSALSAAASGDQIWVAAGTYRPTTGGDRTATFTLKEGVAIYGGFAGSETLLSQRDWTTNVVTLSGDLLGDDVGFSNTAENSYHVVTGATGATLDGVRVSGGNANGENLHRYGGGLYSSTSHPVLRNVTISGNAAIYGGGMCNFESSPILTNVTVWSNKATLGGGMFNFMSNAVLTNVTISANTASAGGGMFTETDSNPVLTNVTISGNTATNGGGMFNNTNSRPVLTNVTISGNTATDGGGMFNRTSQPVLSNVTIISNTAQNGHGGGILNRTSSPTLSNMLISGNTGSGIYNEDFSSPALTDVTISGNTAQIGAGMVNDTRSSPLLTNVIISGNQAVKGGGLYNAYQSSPVLTNVTISGNTAQDGGGAYNVYNSRPTLRNSIIWGNSSGISNTTVSTPTISFSLVQGAGGSKAWNPSVGSDGGGNLDVNPLFVTPVPAAPSSAGDLHLQPGSPALDGGSNAVSNPSLPATDRDGNPRISGISVDMGAYERQTIVKRIFLPLIWR